MRGITFVSVEDADIEEEQTGGQGRVLLEFAEGRHAQLGCFAVHKARLEQDIQHRCRSLIDSTAGNVIAYPLEGLELLPCACCEDLLPVLRYQLHIQDALHLNKLANQLKVAYF